MFRYFCGLVLFKWACLFGDVDVWYLMIFVGVSFVRVDRLGFCLLLCLCFAVRFVAGLV